MNIIGVILGGGAGSRLQPLTTKRAKPAVSLAGKYRLVDVPISNCINSQIYQIYLLTQYNSGSLHHHVQAAYQFDAFSRGFVRLLAAEQTPESKDWFQGTADAVRQSMHHIHTAHPDIVVILSGDQLFRMDFQDIIRHHIACKSDITISTTPVSREEATSLGILQVGHDHAITRFVEKPALDELTDDLRAPLLKEERYLASMGIYVFNYSVLERLLQENSGEDFGKHIIPAAIHTQRVYSYIFEGYWKDIGTIGSFWAENLRLTEKDPPFTFYDNDAPIYTRPRFLPPSRIRNCSLENCLLAEGLDLSAARIIHSVLGLRTCVQEKSMIVDSVVMGNDYYEEWGRGAVDKPFGIGKNCRIERAIIDKNVRIGDDVQLSPYGLNDEVMSCYTVKDGILVIPKGTFLPSGTRIGEIS